jgi:beta-lactamase regulating signal transducer with metallopeptidase domain
LDNSLVVALAAPIVWAVSRWRWTRPAEAHLLWLVLLVRLVSPPMAEWPLSISEMRALVAPSAGSPLASVVSENLDDDVAATDRMARFNLAALLAPADLEMGPLSEAGDLSSSSEAFRRARRSLVGIWLAGTLAIMLVTLFRLRHLRRLLRRSEPASPSLKSLVDDVADRSRSRSVAVRTSDALTSPCVACLGRSVLLWPAGLERRAPEAAVESMIAHELAHLSRRDHFVVWLELIASWLCWWNPLFWLVRWRMHETRELACDARAIESKRTSRRDLAEILVQLTHGVHPAASAVSTVGTGFAARLSLRRRLTMLFDERVSGRTSLAGLGLAVVMAVAAAPRLSWSDEDAVEAAPATEAATEEIEVGVSAVPSLEQAEDAIDLDVEDAIVLWQKLAQVSEDESPEPVEVVVEGLDAALSSSEEPGTDVASPTNSDGKPRPTAKVRSLKIGNVLLNIRDVGDGTLMIEAVRNDGDHAKRSVKILRWDDANGPPKGMSSVSADNLAPPTAELHAIMGDVMRLKMDRPLAEADVQARRAVKAAQEAHHRAKLAIEIANGPRSEDVVIGVAAPQAESADRDSELELAEINIEEKRILLEGAQAELAASPESGAAKREVKLAELAVRRAELERAKIERNQKRERDGVEKGAVKNLQLRTH